MVKREAARLIDPGKYRTHLALEPYITVVLAAPFDGVIRQVTQKTNNQVKAQQDLVRLDNTVQKFLLTRAQAAFKAATIEQKLADKKDENQAALAQAKTDVSKAELDLSQHHVDQATLRSPINADVIRILVAEGQFVRAGLLSDHDLRWKLGREGVRSTRAEWDAELWYPKMMERLSSKETQRQRDADT